MYWCVCGVPCICDLVGIKECVHPESDSSMWWLVVGGCTLDEVSRPDQEYQECG